LNDSGHPGRLEAAKGLLDDLARLCSAAWCVVRAEIPALAAAFSTVALAVDVNEFRLREQIEEQFDPASVAGRFEHQRPTVAQRQLLQKPLQGAKPFGAFFLGDMAQREVATNSCCRPSSLDLRV
jgi:hypothetical protein